MVRFKVIKGSHLLLGIAVVALALVVAFILYQSGAAPAANPSQPPGQELVLNRTDSEAKAQPAFASIASGGLRIEVIADTPAPDPEAKGKRILIYHTHTHEAYAQNPDDPYEAIESWRTADTNHSVVRVGAALASALEALGYSVTHDATDHELDALDNAYLRSLETMQRYAESFDLRIDLHRDAYVEGLLPCLETANGAQYAQLMLLVGRGDAYEAAERPPYAANLEYAQRLTSALNARVEGICRNVTVRQARYNQHVDRRCILVEVGHNLNTLEQALASVPHLAQAIDDTLRAEDRAHILTESTRISSTIH